MKKNDEKEDVRPLWSFRQDRTLGRIYLNESLFCKAKGAGIFIDKSKTLMQPRMVLLSTKGVWKIVLPMFHKKVIALEIMGANCASNTYIFKDLAVVKLKWKKAIVVRKIVRRIITFQKRHELELVKCFMKRQV